jgi:hypothetical protein
MTSTVIVPLLEPAVIVLFATLVRAKCARPDAGFEAKTHD